jgi:hypothetical protein
MRVDFVDLVTEIPDGWIDDSTLTYSIPNPDELAAPLSRKPAAGPCGNIAIKWDRGAGPVSARAYLDARLVELEQGLAHFTVEQRRELGSGADALAVAECSCELGAPLKQLLAVRRLGPLMLVVTGTTFPGVYERFRNTFVEIAQQIVPRR